MDTSSLTDSSPRFEKVGKGQLYYNLYRYSINFRLEELSCLRNITGDNKKDHALIDRQINFLDNYRRRIKTWGGNWANNWKMPLNKQDVDNLHDFCDLINSVSSDYKLIIYGNSGYIYTNDLQWVSLLESRSYLGALRCQEVTIDRPGDCIKLKNPQHKFRTFLRNRWLGESVSKSLRCFLNNQSEIRLSPSLEKWVDYTDGHRCLEYLFFDHDDQGIISMLSLISPGITRKTIPIIKDK
jgi:hypothetical protein